MGILFMIVWIGFIMILLKKHTELIFNPMTWLFAGWSFCFGLYCFSGIDYSYKLSIAAGAYYWGIAICAYLGFRISKKCRITIANHGKRKHLPKISKISGKTYAFFACMTCVGCILYIFDILRLNSISFALHGTINMSFISHIGLIMCCMGLDLWLYECMNAVMNNCRFRISSFLCMLCYLVPAILTSGRQSILIFAISTFVVLFYGFSKVKKYTYSIYLKVPLVVGCIGLFAYITLISANRANVSNKAALFNYMYQCDLSDATSSLLDKLGILKVFIMEMLYYYSHELSMFEVLFSRYNGPKFWGMSQLSLLARNISDSSGQSIFDRMWNHLDAMSADAGVYSHVWRSAAGNCLLDFGIIGGLVFALICGYAIGRFYNKYRKNKTPYGTVGTALICAGMLFAMQFSPISENYWLYPFIWWLILPIIGSLTGQGKSTIK